MRVARPLLEEEDDAAAAKRVQQMSPTRTLLIVCFFAILFTRCLLCLSVYRTYVASCCAQAGDDLWSPCSCGSDGDCDHCSLCVASAASLSSAPRLLSPAPHAAARSEYVGVRGLCVLVSICTFAIRVHCLLSFVSVSCSRIVLLSPWRSRCPSVTPGCITGARTHIR